MTCINDALGGLTIAPFSGVGVDLHLLKEEGAVESAESALSAGVNVLNIVRMISSWPIGGSAGETMSSDSWTNDFFLAGKGDMNQRQMQKCIM